MREWSLSEWLRSIGGWIGLAAGITLGAGFTLTPLAFAVGEDAAGRVIGTVTVVIFGVWVALALLALVVLGVAYVGTWLGTLFGFAEWKRGRE